MVRVACAVLLLVSCCTGCFFHLKSVEFTAVSGKELPKPANQCVVYFESLTRPEWIEFSGTPDDFEVELRGKPKERKDTKAKDVPRLLFRAMRKMGAFANLTDSSFDNHDLVIKGRLECASMHHPWWGYLQLIDLALHALVLPTLPIYATARCEFRICDTEGKLLRAYVARVTERMCCNLLAGGMVSYTEEPQRKADNWALKTCLDLMRKDLAPESP